MVRDECGFPFRVHSAYRCPVHDKAIGGEGNHPTGKAIDIGFDSLDQMLRAIGSLIKYGFRRFGFSWKGLWLHVDCVPDRPKPAVWEYK